jgi:integrase/recombinase XerD
VQTGLRLTELTGLKICDLHLGDGAHVCCQGKGRKDRRTPLDTSTGRVLKAWLRELDGNPHGPLFRTRQGTTLSPDAVESLVAEHARRASCSQPSLRDKKVTPHVLRHTNAMQLLRAGVDTSTIALWLGHERVQTTDIYLHADISMKEKALGQTPTPVQGTRAVPTPSDALMRFLEGH